MSKKDNDILDAIKIMIEEENKKLEFNRYIQVIVTTTNSDGSYDVKYKGQTIPSVKPRMNTTFSLNDVCYACLPNNQINFIFLDTKIP